MKVRALRDDFCRPDALVAARTVSEAGTRPVRTAGAWQHPQTRKLSSIALRRCAGPAS
jgi:hypothetical protein